MDRNFEGVQVQIIRDPGEWDRLEPEWEVLFNASPSSSPPLSFAWLREWWRIYGPVYGDRGRGLRILVVRRDGRLIGALPLYESAPGVMGLGARRLAFLSTGEDEFEETCADYLDMLSLPEESAACCEALRTTLQQARELRWNLLDLSDVSERSALVDPKQPFIATSWLAQESRGSCPIADLSGGFEAYLQRLSANTRQQGRRELRSVEKMGAVFDLADDAAKIDGFFEDLIRVHQERWTAVGKPGCFAAARFTEFHRRLCQMWVPAGRAILARFSAGESVIAVLYGFRVGDKFDFYQSGIDTKAAEGLKHPGLTAHLLLMKRLAESGVAQYDFLRGASQYKQKLATEEKNLVRLCAQRPGLRSYAQRATDVMGRAARRGLKWVKRATEGTSPIRKTTDVKDQGK